MSTRSGVGRACWVALTLLILCLPISEAMADQPRVYQKIELAWPTVSDWQVIRSMPDLELMEVEEGAYVKLLSRPELTQRLEDSGLSPKVVVEDLAEFYGTRMRGENFGDFYTYSEATAALDSIHTAYPNLTTEKFSLGTTWEGRDIWAIKISDNADIDEDEPEVLFDAIHHAREPATISVILGYLWHLCRNYGTDPEATFIVDNREIWFVPVVNPDGYVYNETTYPQGGGMWRKNMRDNPGGCDGVDNNRNYSVDWGGSGADPDPCGETYYGPSAFSEPENQAMRNFIISRNFITHDSYHAVVPIMLFPWGYTSIHTPDHDTFESIAAERVRDSGYPYGAGADSLYPVSGGMFDWCYSDTTGKSKIFSFTTEVSGGDFWPPESAIPGIVAENMYSNIYLSLVAGSYVQLEQVDVQGGDGNGRMDPGEDVDLVVTLKNPGVLAGAADVSLILQSDDAYIEIHDAHSSYGGIGAGGSADNSGDPFHLTVDPDTPVGHKVVLELYVSWDAGAENQETATLTVGIPPIILSDDFESGNLGWSQDPSHTASTGDWVIIDPNPTEFQPGDDTTPPPGTQAWITAQNSAVGTDDVDDGISALRSPVWDLSGYDNVILTLNYFHGQRDAGDDPGGDFFRIDLSNDAGATYPESLVVIGDIHHGPAWQPLEAALDEYLPLTDQMRIRFQASDGPGPGDIVEAGFDDLVLMDGGSGNQPPGAPALAAPGDGSTVTTATPTLRVVNASDPEGDPLTYGFHVYSDSLLTSPVTMAEGVTEGSIWTSWQVDVPLANGPYWWRAHAEDAEERGPFMTAASFIVDVGTDVVGEGAGSVLSFRAASPNPFAENTRVHFSLPRKGRVRAEVFDSRGRKVRSLYHGVMEAGPQIVSWDGTDEEGHPTAAGVYFVLLHAGDRVQSMKLTLVR